MSEEKKLLTESEIKKMIDNTKASMAVEGMVPLEEVIEIIKEYFKNNISENEALSLIFNNIKKING